MLSLVRSWQLLCWGRLLRPSSPLEPHPTGRRNIRALVGSPTRTIPFETRGVSATRLLRVGGVSLLVLGFTIACDKILRIDVIGVGEPRHATRTRGIPMPKYLGALTIVL